ncbi:MAG: phosphate ABC transporter permease PstA [Thermoanaerobaculia bacterium]
MSSARPQGHPALATEAVARRLKKRYAAERRFKGACITALSLALLFLVLLFANIAVKGYTAFEQTYIGLDIRFDPQTLDPTGERDPEVLRQANYNTLVRDALTDLFPEATGRSERRELAGLVSNGAAFQLQDMVENNPSLIGLSRRVWLIASDDADMLRKGNISRDVPEEQRRLSDRQIAWMESLEAQGRVEMRFHRLFFVNGDSREPELAGIRGAVLGSFYTMLVTLALSLPLGVAAAIYLEEFAPQNRWTDLIEVNINNLAAVPSIVFGLLGLALFLNVLGLPRSAPLVGGIVLSLMTLPVVIIAARAALRSIPPSISEAAYGLGASRMQVMFHHRLPLALPGILTGTILGMARALGETAPLLMIGMVAFIVDVPKGIFDPATVLPVQVYLWADSPERAFVEKTSAAILVLLAFLILMNLAAVLLRRKTERQW